MIFVLAATTRTLLFHRSAMYKLPWSSKANAAGPYNCALVATPPSPLLPHDPVPAYVVMILVLAATTRTLWLAIVIREVELLVNDNDGRCLEG